MPLWLRKSFIPQCIPISQQGDHNTIERALKTISEALPCRLLWWRNSPWRRSPIRNILQWWNIPAKTVELGELQPRGHDSFPPSSCFLLAFFARKGLADLGHEHAPLLSPGPLPAGTAWCPALVPSSLTWCRCLSLESRSWEQHWNPTPAGYWFCNNKLPYLPQLQASS